MLIKTMEQITRDDLRLIQDLSARVYSDNTMSSNATDGEKEHFMLIKKKLKAIASLFAEKYKQFGPFKLGVSSGNPLTRRGRLNWLWSVFFKGAPNKQYAAQISFVINPKELCLDVGFYFGGASAHSLSLKQKNELETNLKLLGRNLANAIRNNDLVKSQYISLFEYGFYSYSQGIRSNSKDWIQIIESNPKDSHIIAKIYPNDLGNIEISTIDAYVAQVVFLMDCIENIRENMIPLPQTPEQRAKRAKRFAQIGLEGEFFILRQEESKLKKKNPSLSSKYPRHVAMESDSYGYDILSLDEQGKEIFIEVKTTTCKKDDWGAKRFFLSSYEFDFYMHHKMQYKLYRVYDIENDPYYEELNIENMEVIPDVYIMRY